MQQTLRLGMTVGTDPGSHYFICLQWVFSENGAKPSHGFPTIAANQQKQFSEVWSAASTLLKNQAFLRGRVWFPNCLLHFGCFPSHWLLLECSFQSLASSWVFLSWTSPFDCGIAFASATIPTCHPVLLPAVNLFLRHAPEPSCPEPCEDPTAKPTFSSLFIIVFCFAFWRVFSFWKNSV